MAVAFPAGVSLQTSGYSLQDASLILRSEVERGPAKVRRDATDPVVTANGTLFFSSRQAVAVFRAWFYSPTGANAGAAWVDWLDPRAGINRSIRIVSLAGLGPYGSTFGRAQQPVVFEYLETVEEIAALAPRRWDFNTDVEGWTAYPGQGVLIWSAGSLVVQGLSTGGTPAIRSPALGILGAVSSKVRASIKRLSGSGWDGGVIFQNTARPFDSNTNRQTIANPIPNIGDSAVATWDMAAVPGTDWTSTNIVNISLILGMTNADSYEVYWIEVVAP